jgi:hypothetical protein
LLVIFRTSKAGVALPLACKTETYGRTLTSPFRDRLVLSANGNWSSSMLSCRCLVRYGEALMCHRALAPISLEAGVILERRNRFSSPPHPASHYFHVGAAWSLRPTHVRLAILAYAFHRCPTGFTNEQFPPQTTFLVSAISNNQPVHRLQCTTFCTS